MRGAARVVRNVSPERVAVSVHVMTCVRRLHGIITRCLGPFALAAYYREYSFWESLLVAA